MLDYLKIVKSRWIVLEKAFDNPADIEISTVGTGRDILFLCTFAYFTHMLTEYCFYPILATAIAIDVFR